MRLTLSASALMLALSAPAQGVNKEQWGFIQAGDEARLFYGVPESDSVTIVFACEPKKKNRDRDHRPAGEAQKGTAAQDHAEQRQHERRP
jgi:hypothetical protein